MPTITFKECLHNKVEDSDARIIIWKSSKGCLESIVFYENVTYALKTSSDELLASEVDEFQPHFNVFTKKLEYWVTICHLL